MRLLLPLILAVLLGSCSLGGPDETDFENWYAFSALDAAGEPATHGWVGFYRVENDVVGPPEDPDWDVAGVYGHWMLDDAAQPLYLSDELEGEVRGRVRGDDSLEVVFGLPNPTRSFTLYGLQDGEVIRGRWEQTAYGEVEARGPFTARLFRRARRPAPTF